MSSPLLALLAAHKAVTAVVAAVVVVVPTAAVAMTGDHRPTAAVVKKVVDGDTVDVTYEGGTHRIRLLNVDTPETVNPAKPVQCLGPEAVQFLRKRLPQGTAVQLRFDKERLDRYERELAGVFVDDELVNAEIARAGLGTAVLYEPNDRFYAEVVQAQEEAERRQMGLYSPKLRCTLPAQVAQLEQEGTALAATPANSTADLVRLQQYRRSLSAASNKSKKLAAVLSSPSRHFNEQAYRGVLHAALTRRVDDTALLLTQADAELKQRGEAIVRMNAERAQQQARAKAERAEAERAARAKERARAQRAAARRAAREAAERAQERAEARERRQAAERAAEKTAADEAARREAKAKLERAAEAAKREAARLEARAAEQRRQRTSEPNLSTLDPSLIEKYTGCRAYVDTGTSVDANGRRYLKISCPR